MAALASPYFVVGAARSGTTMLRLMLDRHPQIACFGEFNFVVNRIGPDGRYPDLADYYDWLETNRVFRAASLTIDRALSYPQLAQSFLRQKQHAAGKKITGAVVHRRFERLLQFWPQASLIHIVRDGRDVAHSSVNMGWAGHVYYGAEGWVAAEQGWDDLRAALAPGQFFELKYEDLVRQPESQLARLCAFLSAAYDPQMLEYPKDTTYVAPDPRRAEQWRRKLSAAEVRLLEARIGELLLARGYSLSGLPPRRMTAPLAAWIFLQNRWGRLRFRWRRHGFKLWLLDVLSRRFNLAALQRRTRLKLNEIDTLHLQ